MKGRYLSVNAVENAADSLETALISLQRSDDLRWKWVGFPLHHALYSFCVAALHHGNWETVTSRGRDDEKFYAMQGDDPWHACQKVRVPETKVAYRLVWNPITGNPPCLGRQPKGDDREVGDKRLRRFSKAKLIGFWTALARAQDGHYWMNRYIHSKPLVLSDEQVQNLSNAVCGF